MFLTALHREGWDSFYTALSNRTDNCYDAFEKEKRFFRLRNKVQWGQRCWIERHENTFSKQRTCPLCLSLRLFLPTISVITPHRHYFCFHSCLNKQKLMLYINPFSPHCCDLVSVCLVSNADRVKALQRDYHQLKLTVRSQRDSGRSQSEQNKIMCSNIYSTNRIQQGQRNWFNEWLRGSVPDKDKSWFQRIIKKTLKWD